MLDKFGIKKIYPTKDSGREWYINMDDPKSDGLFFITSDHKITRQDDGTWQINNTEVRLNVDTPPNVEPWKNVEITGYGRVVETIFPSKSTDDNESSADDYGFSWRGRRGEHSIDNPCEGTSYIAILDTNGTVGWEKEIWHTGGYTDTRGLSKVLTEPILNRWIVFKAIIYNINNNTAVKMD